MKCPDLSELPPAPSGKTGWPWTTSATNSAAEMVVVPSVVTGVSPVGVGVDKDAADTAATTEESAKRTVVAGVSLTNWPRISLVMPAFNAVQYIEEAIRSVLLQGYPDLELIVIDGGSTDGTVEIIRRYAPWLTYWVSERDRGQSHAINKGLARATGRYFNWVNADDVLCEDGLWILVDLFCREPQRAGVFGAMEVFDHNGYRTTWIPRLGDKEAIGAWGRDAFLPQPSALFSCALCKAIGGVNERLHYVMDIELILRLSDQGGFAVTLRPTYRYRHHEGAKTVKGDLAGMVELIAAEFNLGMSAVAETWLKWRMEGAASGAVGRLTGADVAKMVDEWGYAQVVRYVAHRLWKNLKLRVACRTR